MMRGWMPSLARDQKGATLVEFALAAPTVLFMSMGLYELGHGMYVQSVVSGVMQDAGRDSTLEGATRTEMRDLLEDRVEKISPGSTVTLSWHNFGSYTEIGELERYTDVNEDGKCSKDEPYEDANENGVHDYYTGDDGIGNARDAVVFRATIEYERLFPMPGMMGWSKTNKVEGVTVLRNQPYGQNDRTPPIERCTGFEDYGTSCSSNFSIGTTCNAPPPPPPPPPSEPSGPCLLGIILCG